MWLWALPLGPSALGLALLAVQRRVPAPLAAAVAVAAAAGALALAGHAWMARPEASVDWLPAGDSTLTLGLTAAAEGAPLSVMVAAVSLLVFVYAIGLMGRGADARFFGFMTLFLGAMQTVVLATDLLTVLIGFELVGTCSWALIGYRLDEGDPVSAGNRAFLTTRATDLGLYLAAMAAFAGDGEAGFETLTDLPPTLAAVAAFGLVVAAAGKSAQLPVSGWLSGAMLGPSPVSALLHSSTMVAAGAVLLVKALPLLEAVPAAAMTVLWLGTATALAAAALAVMQSDLKQLLAASTVSQFGYVFAAIGATGGAAAVSHLVNHAAFKAALFMVAGVLLHQGLRRLEQMGGLARRLAPSAAFAGLAALSLAALPPAGGFFSKDAVLSRVAEHSGPAYWLLILTAALTALYAARAWIGAFAGRTRSEAARRAEEEGWPANAPVAVLAVAALIGGVLILPPVEHAWTEALGLVPLPALKWSHALTALGAALAGLGAALLLHRLERLAALPGSRSRAAEGWVWLPAGLDAAGRGAIALGRGIDRIDALRPAEAVGTGARALATVIAGIDARSAAALAHPLRRLPTALEANPVAGGTRRLAEGTLALAGAAGSIDRRVVDGALALLTRGLDAISAALSRAQSGALHRYYAIAAVGFAALVALALLLALTTG